MSRARRLALLVAWAVLAPTPSRVAATTPAALYQGQSLVCHPLHSAATCELWLNRDGRYAVFYDTGVPAVLHGASGPFRYEGRQGAYAVTAAADGVQLCLRPDPEDGISRGAGVEIALFHEAGCLLLPVHPIGEAFTVQLAGQSYDLELVQGR